MFCVLQELWTHSKVAITLKQINTQVEYLFKTIGSKGQDFTILDFELLQ